MIGPMTRAIGVDIGGTQTRVAAVEGERILARRAFATRGIREVEEAIREVLANVGWNHPATIGVGGPGPMDMRGGKMLGCPNLPHWNGVEVTKELRNAFGCPVYLANDATCAAIGELAFGHRSRDFVYVTWSTGIGGGIVSGGRVVWGVTGQAGEIGHVVLRPDGSPCRCGKRGCLEAMASGVGIARAAAETLGESLTAREVVDRARRGDSAADAIVSDACRALGQGIAILSELLEPELIVLGGGLTGSWGFLGPRVRAAAKAMARGEPRIELTPLGDDVGLLGAAALPAHFPVEWRSA
jgi:glucokinase